MYNAKEEGIKILKEMGVELGKTNAYHWGDSTTIEGLHFSLQDYYSGWWNECYNFISFFPKNWKAKEWCDRILNKFNSLGNGWKAKRLINNGVGLEYCKMTEEESKKKALDNLMSGGRMSD